MESPKPSQRFSQLNPGPIDFKETDINNEKQLQKPAISDQHQEPRLPETDIERDNIKKLRQQKMKRETTESIDITTVIKKKSILEQLKEMMASIKKSLKDLYKDGKYVLALKREHGSWKNLHLVEYIKYKNINYDLIKFIPYSIFLFVPFTELLLPFYILLLPNSTPSQFYSEKAIGQRTEKMITKQKNGFEIIKKRLYTTFGNDFLEIEQKVNILRENPGDKETYEKLLALDAKIQQKLQDEWTTGLSKQLNFYKLTIEEQEAILKVFYIEYISGTYMINQMYNIPFLIYNFIGKLAKLKQIDFDEERWKMNIFPLTLIKLLLFRVQLLRHFKKVAKEDRLLFKNVNDELNKCSSIELFELIRKRGFKIESDTDSKQFLTKFWAQHKEIQNPDIKLWSIMIRHHYADYLI